MKGRFGNVLYSYYIDRMEIKKTLEMFTDLVIYYLNWTHQVQCFNDGAFGIGFSDKIVY